MNLIVFLYGLAAEILQTRNRTVVYCLPVLYSLLDFLSDFEGYNFQAIRWRSPQGYLINLYNIVYQHLFHEGAPKIICWYPQELQLSKTFAVQKTKKMVMHGDYAAIHNCLSTSHQCVFHHFSHTWLRRLTKTTRRFGGSVRMAPKRAEKRWS